MEYESEHESMIPTGYESERLAGIDHDARHGDPNERPTITDPGAAAGLCGRNDNGGFFAGPRRTLQLHRPYPGALRLSAPCDHRPHACFKRPRRKSAMISRAALWPGAPVTPPPGCVPDPHMYSPFRGPR